MKIQKFNALHQQATPLIICNVWDAASAKTAEKLHFSAIGTSSAAIASMLGYEDGEQMSFEELLFIVKRIAISSALPLTVDIEAGYSQDPLTTVAYIKSLVEAGVVGINIEDSKVNQTRALVDANSFAGYLSAIKGQLVKDQIDVFINVRTDTFLLGQEDALFETQKRAKLYEIAGADGLFVPCITKTADIAAVVKATAMPVNVMCMPDLPDFKSLTNLAVKRISMGNFLFDKLSSEFENTLNSILEDQSFKAVF
ncbi:MAG: isocitrate lyase/phosphoenolpyruvate mutase family protein [Oceanospirillaceae bacterium]|nr:isocitrate lyase/phosphoenolpyruvate mutase family protein [Oceanospirillaceae bacterium]